MNEIRPNSTHSQHQIAVLKNNIRLYIQGCANGGVLILTIISYHFLSLISSTRMARFATTTLNFEFAHTMNGVILIAFNKPLRNVLLGKTSTPQKSRVHLIDSIVI
ncbi:hypothetical protein Y032_0057g2829 [Ancylostoma ceylanicum]|nr:hypothetical protein Y032_0057g2829 [Ancylostoma ceylanicum]